MKKKNSMTGIIAVMAIAISGLFIAGCEKAEFTEQEVQTTQISQEMITPQAIISGEIDPGVLSNEQQEMLFKAFSQGDTSITRKFGGTGLGLSICKQLIELMGGQLTVRSELKRGSIFEFSLNYKVVSGGGPRNQIINLKKLNALIIDDSIDAAQVLCTYLTPYFKKLREQMGLIMR